MAPMKKKRKITVEAASKPALSDKKPLKKRGKLVKASESASNQVLSDNKPLRKKRRLHKLSESTSTEDLSDKKRLKDEEKSSNDVESNLEKVIATEKILVGEKDSDVKEPIATPVVKKKRASWLKLDPPIGSNSLTRNSKQSKDAKSTSHVQTEKGKEANSTSHFQTRKGNEANSTQIQTSNGKKRSRATKDEDKGNNGKREKGIAIDKNEDMETSDEEVGKDLGGLIFMCNAKTKPDCFGYQVMGVPANKKDIVMGIKPGLTLFLYDYDLKLMYGIFKASSAGGMKLKPAAFGGGFPAQVCFSVHKDCLPLHEKIFKKALKSSYDERTHKFKTELTTKQVRHLINLFRPASWLQLHGQPSVQEHDSFEQRYQNNHGPRDTMVNTTPMHHDNHQYHVSSGAVPSQSPLFPTEQEYRNYGLRQERQHLLPTSAGGDDIGQTWNRNKFDHQLEQLPRNPPSTSISQSDPFFISEKDYRTYGLRAPQRIHSSAPPTMTSNGIVKDYGKVNLYDESTALLVNRYLTLPMQMERPAESYPLAGTVPNDGKHLASELNERPYAYYASSREPSVFNQGTHHQSGADLTSAPVSHRYSFAGPPLSQHR